MISPADFIITFEMIGPISSCTKVAPMIILMIIFEKAAKAGFCLINSARPMTIPPCGISPPHTYFFTLGGASEIDAPVKAPEILPVVLKITKN